MGVAVVLHGVLSSGALTTSSIPAYSNWNKQKTCNANALQVFI